MIKQFNFYDIYGYLIPGMLLLGVLWVPVGMTMQSIPEQDLSKALFLGVLAYIVGHLLGSISSTVVPSTVKDEAQQHRIISDRILDVNNDELSVLFKQKLQEQVIQVFGISLDVHLDGNGKDETSKSRNTAFFLARSYLIVRKSAAYAEQFQGLYSMMRALGCAFCIGVAYFLGWATSPYFKVAYISRTISGLVVIGIFGTLILASRVEIRGVLKAAVALFWTLDFFGLGFSTAITSASHFGHVLHPNVQRLLLVAILVMIVAAIRCFAAYKKFARRFADTVWGDFSACVAYGATPGATQSAKDEIE